MVNFKTYILLNITDFYFMSVPNQSKLNARYANSELYLI